MGRSSRCILWTAQVLTSYAAAGILTRNEARAKLGEAPVADPAASLLLVTTGSGPAPLPKMAAIGESDAQAITKRDSPENPQPRDWHGRFATAEGRGTKDDDALTTR